MDRDSQARTASIVNLVAAIWLLLAPSILQYATANPRTNDLWLGIIVGIVALIRLFTPIRSAVLSWINTLAGIWLIIAPFVLKYAFNAPRWNDVIVGVVVAGFSIWSLSAGTTTTHRGHARA